MKQYLTVNIILLENHEDLVIDDNYSLILKDNYLCIVWRDLYEQEKQYVRKSGFSYLELLFSLVIYINIFVLFGQIIYNIDKLKIMLKMMYICRWN